MVVSYMSQSPILRMETDGVAAATLMDALLERKVDVRLQVHGRSMWPVIPDGAILTIHPFHNNDLRVGNILGYIRDRGDIRFHRVIRTRFRDGVVWLLMRGDAWASGGEWIPINTIVGTVSICEYRGRHRKLNSGWRRLTGLWWNAGLYFIRRVCG